MIQFEKDKKPDPIYNKIIVALISEEFIGLPVCYRVLYSSMHRYPHYHLDGEEVPVSAIIKWAEI